MRPLSGERRREIEQWFKDWGDGLTFGSRSAITDLLASEAYWREAVRKIAEPRWAPEGYKQTCVVCGKTDWCSDDLDPESHFTDCPWVLAQ